MSLNNWKMPLSSEFQQNLFLQNLDASAEFLMIYYPVSGSHVKENKIFVLIVKTILTQNGTFM